MQQPKEEPHSDFSSLLPLYTVPVCGSSPAFLPLSRESDQGSEPTPDHHGRGVSEQCRLLAITVLG